MSDEVDLANDLADLAVSKAVKLASDTIIPVNETGKCWACDEKVDNGRRWCDAECRQLWEDLKRNG